MLVKYQFAYDFHQQYVGPVLQNAYLQNTFTVQNIYVF